MGVTVLGGINQDLVLHVAALPRPGETIHTAGLSRGSGGKGLNKAVAAARYGAATALLGAVGDDAAGGALRAVLQAEGVDAAGVRIVAGEGSGQAHICLAADGANTILVTAGANDRVAAANMPTTAGVVLTDLEVPHAAVAALFARASGLTLLNAAPANEAARPLLAQADVLIVNETELAVYAGPGDPADAARRLIARADQLVVVTLGGEGCLLVAADRTVRLPAFDVPVVDTVGAGDCFCGVLAAAMAEGQGEEQALRTASAAAALAVGRPGAAAAMPTRGEVEALLAGRLVS